MLVEFSALQQVQASEQSRTAAGGAPDITRQECSPLGEPFKGI